jgi:hypothetical protein
MRDILRGEGLWELIESQFSPSSFPAILAGETITIVGLRKKKALAIKPLTMVVKDDLIDSVAEYIDPSVVWATLKNSYQANSQSQILTLTGQLQNLKIPEGSSDKEYITKARELKNWFKYHG